MKGNILSRRKPWCVSYSLQHRDKTPDRSKGGGVLSAHGVRVWSMVVGAGMVVGAILSCSSRSLRLLAYTWAWKQRGEGWSSFSFFFFHFIKAGILVHRMVPPKGSLPDSGNPLWSSVIETTNTCLSSALGFSQSSQIGNQD